MTKQRGWTVGALVAVIVGIVVALGVSNGWIGDGDPGADDTTSGVIVRYDGRDYWVSDYEITPTALGETLATGLQVQDTTADVKAIEGQDPTVTLAEGGLAARLDRLGLLDRHGSRAGQRSPLRQRPLTAAAR